LHNKIEILKCLTIPLYLMLYQICQVTPCRFLTLAAAPSRRQFPETTMSFTLTHTGDDATSSVAKWEERCSEAAWDAATIGRVPDRFCRLTAAGIKACRLAANGGDARECLRTWDSEVLTAQLVLLARYFGYGLPVILTGVTPESIALAREQLGITARVARTS